MLSKLSGLASRGRLRPHPRLSARFGLRAPAEPTLSSGSELAARTALGRGIVAFGTVWLGGDTEPFRGFVVVDGSGRLDYAGPFGQASVPSGLPVIGGPDAWIGPGVVDAHVHLGFGGSAGSGGSGGFGDIDDCLRRGLVGVRDLGAPPDLARSWRTGHRSPVGLRPLVTAAGPIVTAPGGYPSRTWGADGYSAFVRSPGEARHVVQRLAADGADLVKVALEPGDAGWPVLSPPVLAAVVQAAHDAGLAVVAHALRTEMVRRAVDGGVDELVHTPTELLPEQLVDLIAERGISVTSTLQTFFTAGVGRVAAANAAALYRAGVVLRYGTDLGNDGTLAGVDPRELDRLADTGLGRLGALRAATTASATAPGMRARTGRLVPGDPAALVVLSGDPIAEPGVWRAPTAVVADGRLLQIASG
jgi:imidazolonepropionase-like amidohydrolase